MPHLRGDPYDAIDTLDITVMPEALGAGIPLFTDTYPGPMKLTASVPHANGAIRLVHQPQQ